MEYKFEDLEKFMQFSTWTAKQKVEECLRINADLRCNLGTDSTKKEIAEADRKWKKMAKAINRGNQSAFGFSILLADIQH